MACNNADKYKAYPKTELVIILDDLDFTWTKDQIQSAIFMWTAGWSIREMARRLRPYDGINNAIDEVALLIMHLSRQKKIKGRAGGILGNGQ